MAKRRAGKELTDRNWEEEETPEEAGTFEVAGKETLARRVIKKAKRRVKGGDEAESQQDDDPKPSPFAGFAFGSNRPSTTGFSFKSTTTDAQAEPSFSFKPSAPERPPAKPAAATVSTAAEAPPLPAFGGFTSSTTPASTNGAGVSSTPPTAKTSSQYTLKLQNLNRSVSAWIQKHVNENPVCDLTPVFEDYKKHLQEIEKLRTESRSDTGTLCAEDKLAKTTVATASTSSFSFGKSNTQPDAKPATTMTFAPTASSTFSFGKSSGAEQPKSDFSFKVTKEAKTSDTASGFSFGKSETAPASGSFTAGKSEGSGMGSLFGATKPFSFGGIKSSDASVSGESQTTGEEEYEPPKQEVKTVQEKDSLFSKRCKLFYKKGDTYKDRGVGMLHLKKLGDTLQLLVRADTNLGNVILNITLPESLPVSRQGKNNLLMMTPINPPVDRACPQCNKKYPRPQESNACDNGCTPDATALLIRVKTAEDADEAFEKINKLREV